MRKVLLASLVGCSALLSSQTSTAADTGFYLRGTVGHAGIDGSHLGDVADDSDSAYGIDFGWRFLPWLAVEAGYNKLGDFDLNCDPPTGQGCVAVVVPPLDVDSVEVGLAARVPFGDSGFFGQARAGMHRWDIGFGGKDEDPYYGVGLGYGFNERFSLSLNFDRYEAAALDVDRMGLGFEVAF